MSVMSPDGAFSTAEVVGESPLGSTSPVSSLPAQFSLPIPAQIACRKYSLSAVGATAGGAEASASITIDVEKPDPATALTPRSREIIFEAEGESDTIELLARFGDNSVLAVQESSNVTYQSLVPGWPLWTRAGS